MLRRQTGAEPLTYSLLLPATVVAVCTVAWLAVAGRSREGAATNIVVASPVRPTGLGFVIWVLLLTFAGLVASSGVNGAHHAALLWPLPALVIVLSLERLGDLADQVAGSRRTRPRWATGMGVLTALVVVSQVALLVDIDRTIRDRSARTVAWSEEPMLVAEVLRQEARTSGERVVAVTADWGIGTQVQALTSNDGVSVLDRWPWFLSPIDQDLAADLSAQAGEGRRQVILLRHLAEHEVMAGSFARSEQLIAGCRHVDQATTVVFRGRFLEAIRTSC